MVISSFFMPSVLSVVSSFLGGSYDFSFDTSSGYQFSFAIAADTSLHDKLTRATARIQQIRNVAFIKA